MEVLSPVASRVKNPDGSYTITTSAGQRWFRDDQDAWAPVVFGSDKSLPGNCEFVLIGGGSGYRMWKPRGKPPYNPEWLPTDYWLQIEDLNDVTDFSPRRSTVTEQATLAKVDSKRPAWKWTWNDNLIHKVIAGVHTWIDSLTNEVIFTKQEPKAWSVATPSDVRIGSAIVEDDGTVIVDIDLSGLKFPVTLDPTTAFASLVGDGYVAATADGTWSVVTTASVGAAVDYTATQEDIVQSWFNGSLYRIRRGYIPFDTSSIGAGATLSSATLTLQVTDNSNNADAITIHLVPQNQASTTQLVTADYGAITKASGGSRLLSGLAAGSQVFTITDLTLITKGGNTKIGLISNLDLNESVAPTGLNQMACQLSEGATDPSLSVTYTESASGGRNIAVMVN